MVLKFKISKFLSVTALFHMERSELSLKLIFKFETQVFCWLFWTLDFFQFVDLKSLYSRSIQSIIQSDCRASAIVNGCASYHLQNPFRWE